MDWGAGLEAPLQCCRLHAPHLAGEQVVLAVDVRVGLGLREQFLHQRHLILVFTDMALRKEKTMRDAGSFRSVGPEAPE